MRYPEILGRLPVAAYLLEPGDPPALKYVSPRVEALLGFPAEEFVDSRLFAERLHPEDRRRIWRAMRQRFESGAPSWEQEYRLMARDGRAVWVLDRDTGAVGAGGGGRLFAGAIVDITALKETEADLALRGRTAMSAISALGEGVLVVGSDGRIVLANDAAVELTGISREGLVGAVAGGSPVAWRYEDGTAIDPSNSPGRMVLDSGQPLRDMTTYFERPGGDSVWVSVTGLPLTREGESKPYGAVYSFRDVTEQHATSAALRQARELARAAFQHAPTGNAVFSLRPEDGWRPLEVNAALCELFDYSEDELRQQTIHSLAHPEDAEKAPSRDWERLIAGELQTYQAERRLLHRDGHVIWTLLSVSLIRDEAGEPLYGISQVQDISARKRSEAQQEAIASLGQHALAGLGTSDLMDEAMEVLAGTLDIDFAVVLEDVPTEDELVVRAAAGGPARAIGSRAPRQTSVAGRTLRSRGPLVIEDWEAEEMRTGSAVLEEYGPRSSMNVIIGEPESPWGVLGVHTLERRGFRADEISFVQAVANVLATAIHRWRIEEEARERSLHDPLTGLPNRTLFNDRLEHALERSGRRPGAVAVLLIDLDRFKLVNDSLGHEAGDELLRSVAPRLRRAVPLTNTVARFGGDEFVVLCEDLHSEQDAVDAAERVMAIFAQPFTVGERELFATGTIGVALAAGDANPEALIRDADAAMYRAKALGRGRYEMFDEDLRKRVSERLRTETALRRALAREELRTFFQPIVSLEHPERIVGAEALLRWEDAEHGWMRPADFIPVAEDSGLIVGIGKWILEEACRCATEWRTADKAPLMLSVNLSVRQLAEPDFPSLVMGVLQETGMEPSRLGLEVTESVLVGESNGQLRVLSELKGLGVRIVLDDFGTGYSSLSYLNRLPIDVLKLDRSFVAQLDVGASGPSRAIVASVVRMAHALGLTVIAEGVETEAQRDHLRTLGCELAQGFLFARPMAPDTFASQLERPGARG